MSVAKPGNPHGRKNEILVTTSVRLDTETLTALRRLEAPFPNVKGRRSMVIRKLILDADRHR